MGSRVKHKIARYAWQVLVSVPKDTTRYPQSLGKTTSSNISLDTIRLRLSFVYSHRQWQNRCKEWCDVNLTNRYSFQEGCASEDGPNGSIRIDDIMSFEDRHDAIMFSLVKDRL